jgi:Transposase DDE domain
LKRRADKDKDKILLDNYAQRKEIMELVKGQIKEASGLRRFLLRGLEELHGVAWLDEIRERTGMETPTEIT